MRLGSYSLANRRDMILEQHDSAAVSSSACSTEGLNSMSAKRPKTEMGLLSCNTSSHTTAAAPHDLGLLPSFALPAFATAEDLPNLWETLCLISSRLLLAKAAEPKLMQIVSKLPKQDEEERTGKEIEHESALLTSLQNEILLLSEKKTLVERLIANFTDLSSPPHVSLVSPNSTAEFLKASPLGVAANSATTTIPSAPEPKDSFSTVSNVDELGGVGETATANESSSASSGASASVVSDDTTLSI